MLQTRCWVSAIAATQPTNLSYSNVVVLILNSGYNDKKDKNKPYEISQGLPSNLRTNSLSTKISSTKLALEQEGRAQSTDEYVISSTSLSRSR